MDKSNIKTFFGKLEKLLDDYSIEVDVCTEIGEFKIEFDELDENGDFVDTIGEITGSKIRADKIRDII